MFADITKVDVWDSQGKLLPVWAGMNTLALSPSYQDSSGRSYDFHGR
jgi:hypothetical protein